VRRHRHQPGATWQTFTFELTSPLTTGPAGAFVSFNVGDPSLQTIWLDDARIELLVP